MYIFLIGAIQSYIDVKRCITEYEGAERLDIKVFLIE